MDVSSMKITVLGAGTMGRAVAQLFATNGHEVQLYNRTSENLERALGLIRTNLEENAALELVRAEEIPAILARIHPTDEIRQAVEQADFVSENVTENEAVKIAVFREIDEFAREDCLFTSDTSTMNIFEFIRVKNPARLAIAHFFNPAYVMPLVEVVRGEATSDETVERLRALLTSCGKKVAVLNRAIPGFILNRLTIAVFREAMYLAEMGYVSPEDVDTAIISTFGPRYTFEGPFGLSDFAGSEMFLRLTQLLYSEISDAKTPPRLLEEMIAQGKLGVRCGEGFYHYDHPGTAGGKRAVKIIRMIQAINRINEELGDYND